MTTTPRKLPLLRRLLSARGRSLEITTAGWLFIGLTLAVGFAAINSGSNLLHVSFGCLIGLIVASGVLSESMLQRASVRRRLGSPAHAGSPASLHIDLRNASAHRELLAVSVEDDDRRPGGGSARPVFSLALRPAESARLGSQVVLPRRGLHALPPAVVATRFPFGLFVKRRELPPGPPVLVYPAVHDVEPDAGAPGHGDDEGGAHGRARAGEPYALREHRHGDDLHRIHWPATARLGRPVVREFEGRLAPELWIELSPGVAGAPAFEARVEEVASQALALLRQGQRAVGLRYGPREAVSPGTGVAQEARILEFLALVGLGAGQEAP